MADGIKNAYFALEDKWYAALDWLDQRGIPVYKVVDPIDTKIPSFAVAAGLVLLILGLSVFSFGGLLQGGNVNVTFQVVDSESSPLPNVPIQFSYGSVSNETHTSDSLGRIALLVPSGTKIDYQVDVDTYEIIHKSVSASADTLEVIQLEPLQSQTLTKTLKLVNEVGQPILKEASLTFSCSTAYGTAPHAITGTGGTFTVTPNADCIPLSVNVSVDGFDPVQSYPLTAEKDVYSITLLERSIKDATLRVSVVDTQGNGVGDLSISLQKDGIEVDSSQTDSGGTTTFSVAAGGYTIVATDALNGVYSTAQDDVEIASGQTSSVSLTVTKNATSSMQVLVIDKTNNHPLKNAIVKLKQGNTILQTQTTDVDGKATLGVSDKTQSYLVSASAEGYVPAQQTVPGSSSSVSFALERATGTNTAKLFVHLLDQDSDPVTDAKVVLYDADTGFLAPYEGVLSDSNGTATFNGVKTGNYKAFAYKTSLTAFSTEQFFDIADPSTHDYSILLKIPDGRVDVHVVDQDGNPVPFAKVSVYNAFKNTLLGADLTDANGSYELPQNNQKSKADKDVFLVVSKPGYATLTTIQKPVLPDTTQTFSVVLPPVIPSGNVKIELVGVYTEDGKIVTGVGKNQDYVARFRVSIPEEHDTLDTLKVHLRTGEKDIVEKDDWYLTQIRFPRAIVVKGGSWDPNNGVNEDGQSITFGPAKWANGVVSEPNPGIYEFEAGIHVRDTAAAQDILKIFYNAKAQNSETLRDPIDANPIDDLYAATKQATYQVGVTTACDGSFCFDASIQDVQEGRIDDVTDSYSAAVFKDYALTFNLLNDGTAFHTNSNLRIKATSDGIHFTTYEIYTADAQLLQGTVNDHEFKTPLVMGNFTPQKKIGGTIHFKPQIAGSTSITIELVSDQKSVFSKTIQVNAVGSKNMQVTVTPDVFPSNIPLDIHIHAQDDTTSEDLVNATITLRNVSNVVLASGATDGAGNATIQLPGQFPGKKIELRVERPEYNPYVQELEISNKIVTLAPEALGVSINVKTQAEKTSTFTLTNDTSLPIVVKELSIQGNFKGLLDVEKIDSSLHPFVGVTIAPNAQLSVSMKTALTPEGRALSDHEDLKGVVGIQVQNYGSPWSFELPVTYSLGVASEVDDPTCFSAVPHSWVTSTDGKTVTYEFQIQNNCAIVGVPSNLKNLSAKANWNGNELGETVLSVFEETNPTALGAAKVRSGYFSPVLANLPAQDVLTARLDFTPFGGVKGQGEFDVELQAENPLEGKPQLLSSKVNAQISVVNLSDCVSYDKEILDVQSGKKDTLTIETKGCGAPVQFTLQSELELSTKEFTMQGTDKKQIEVSDNALDVGQYPLYVKLEGQEQKLASLNKTIRVRITDPNACLQLNRYEFDVYRDPQNATNTGFDTARLDNLCTQQKVQVKVVIEKSFVDSLKKGIGAGIFAFLGTGASNVLNQIPFLGPESGTTPTPPATDGASSTPPGTESTPASGSSSTPTDVKVEPWTAFAADTYKLSVPTPLQSAYFEEPAIQLLVIQFPSSIVRDGVYDRLRGVKAIVVKAETYHGKPGFYLTLKGSHEATEGGMEQYAVSVGKTPATVTPAPTIPTTGFSILFASGDSPQQKVASGAAEGVGKKISDSVLGGGIKGALGKITGELSLGTNNPWTAFGVVTIGVTLIDYFTSKDQEFKAEVLGKDVEIHTLSMIAGEKGADEGHADPDIKVEKSGIALNPKINLEKPVVGRLESSTLTFTNQSNFSNDTRFRTLLTSGKRLEYTADQRYKNDIPDENKLKANKETDFKTKFHLQFNSIPPESLASTAVPPIALSCDTFSEKSGKTGGNAAPKITLAWDFHDIDLYACDAGNVNPDGVDVGVYCDATQFSIEVIQKVQILRNFIEANAPFACPIQDSQSGTQTQPIPAADIGIASLGVDKIGTQDINILVGVQNNAPVTNHAIVKVEYKLSATGTNVQTVQQNVTLPTGQFIKIGFPVSALAAGSYSLTASIIPETCENCFNSTTADDTLTSTFFIGTGSNLVACEPFTTKRLDAFIDATQASGRGINNPTGLSLDQIKQLVHFHAKLMQDRFSPDFFNDFDRYARKVSFFDAPTYYLDQATGLHRFFTDREKWIVNREGSPVNPEGYLVPGPGIYDVTLDLNFSDSDMKFYKNGEPDAKINVLVEKTTTVEDNSPFYSLPFNGLVGTDDGQGRVGYGVNFSGEIVPVNENANEKVSTIDIANSSPVSTVETSKVDAYTILNSLERGNILTLTKNGTNQLSLKWAPSYATPVMMKVTSTTAKSNVYGYYSVGVNNDTSQSYIGAKGNPWYGVGPNCRDFQDQSLLDAYTPRFDASAVNADCAIVGAQKNISYGFEWCENTIHTGTVPLKTIFYTPQGSLSTITRAAWKDDMTFIGEGVNGGSVPLNGTNVIPGNTPGDTLTSVQKILDLVREDAVCVRNSGAKTEFFWNPKEVFNALTHKEKAAQSACIVK